MHVLYLILTLVATVAILWFGMPWVFETIHEPFQGSAATCVPPQAIQVRSATQEPDDFGTYIERGKQIYNALGYGENMKPSAERAFKDRITQDQVFELNEDFRKALATVSAVPDNTPVPESAKPVFGPTGALLNEAAVFVPTNNWNQVKLTAGYVEERVPPTSLSEQEAQRCESVNRLTTYTAGGEMQDRPVAFKRTDLCNLLGTRDPTTGTITNLDPTIAGCGVCIKDGSPVSQSVQSRFSAALKFIGGLLFSNSDRDAYYASGAPSAQPSLGTCAPGYFFVAGEKDKCTNAANKLNCDEYGSTGGFGAGKSEDGQRDAELAGSCVACVQSNKTTYVYDPPAQSKLANVQLRITVPKGTGFNRVYVATKAKSATNFGDFMPTTIENISEDPTSVITVASLSAEDTIKLAIFQEFPHRPRGLEEVFFVNFNLDTDTTRRDNLAVYLDQRENQMIFDGAKFEKSMNCRVATVAQLQDAFSKGSQVRNAGYALDESSNTYDPYTIHQYPNYIDDTVPNYGTVGVVKITETAPTGVWCYGIKPKRTHITPFTLGNRTLAGSVVQNFYEYMALTNEDGLSADAKRSRYSQYADIQTPQYRGVCLQFESNQNGIQRSIPVERFITMVSDRQVRNSNGTSVSGMNPLLYYSRNGTFADSQRIVEPKPVSPGMSRVLTDQYWIWAADHTKSGFTIECKIPGIFLNPYYSEDLPKCPTGPLYTSKNLLNFVEFDACTNGLTIECMKRLFETIGAGIEAGTWYPTKSEGETALRFKDSRQTIERTPTELIDYLKTLRATANGLGLSETLTPAEKAAAMNDASMKLIGREIVSACETLVDAGGVLTIQNKTGNLDAQCLDQIYRQTYATGSLPATYQSIGDRYSGIRSNELALPEIQQEFPYRTCQPAGSWAPLRGGEINQDAVRQINEAIATYRRTNAGVDSVAAARAVLDQVYQNANDAGVDKTTQQIAIERCYGIRKREFVSNCQGVNIDTIRIMFMDTLQMTDGMEIIRLRQTDREEQITISVQSLELSGNVSTSESKIIQTQTTDGIIVFMIFKNKNNPQSISIIRFELMKGLADFNPVDQSGIPMIELISNGSKTITQTTSFIFPNNATEAQNLWNRGGTVSNTYAIKNLVLNISYTAPQVLTTISTTANNQIIQLVRNNRILTQRLARGEPIEINSIDLTPQLSYRDLVFPAPGTQKIRLESFVGQGWFLTRSGVISNLDTRTTFTLKPAALGLPPTGAPSGSQPNVAKLYRLEGTVGSVLTRTPTGIMVGPDIGNANSSWVILPALNQASAFISLQLANYPTFFLITEIQNNGTYAPKCVDIGTNPTELQKALTCWRLYSSDL